MANGIGRVHNLVKRNRNQPDMTTNILTAPVSVYFLSQHIWWNIDMKLNSSSINTSLSATTDDAHENPDNTIET